VIYTSLGRFNLYQPTNLSTLLYLIDDSYYHRTCIHSKPHFSLEYNLFPALIRDFNHNRRLIDRMKREGMDKVSDTAIVEQAMTAIIAELYIRGN